MWYKLLLNKYFIVGSITVIVVSSLVYRDYSMKKTISDLSNENKNLKVENTILNNSIVKMNQDIEIIKTSNRLLNELNYRLTDDKKELEKTLYRERDGKTSIGELSVKSPSKIEYRINKATKNVFRCLEIITGDKNDQDTGDCNTSVD